ncbi:hypothetical protein VNO77_06017 [Canavalia gladiata]|uniref:Uncharacterized protein n=1 Tax=Canavalia gladiata TaxID=3824 RepID=A0AAN9RER0_CANGL
MTSLRAICLISCGYELSSSIFLAKGWVEAIQMVQKLTPLQAAAKPKVLSTGGDPVITIFELPHFRHHILHCSTCTHADMYIWTTRHIYTLENEVLDKHRHTKGKRQTRCYAHLNGLFWCPNLKHSLAQKSEPL